MAGVAVLGGPFRGFVALAEGAARRAPDFRNLRPVPDLRDGQVRLWLPADFQYDEPPEAWKAWLERLIVMRDSV